MVGTSLMTGTVPLAVSLTGLSAGGAGAAAIGCRPHFDQAAACGEADAADGGAAAAWVVSAGGAAGAAAGAALLLHPVTAASTASAATA
ncbi:hypothetical protein GCM10009760_02790 [Kitasatospora kazusensis]|uniref:Uncharacterized protein n=1 Tax=Kitasatospora kazusensis TaxID=407974 RepID=A0ABN2YPI3_9ACTN